MCPGIDHIILIPKKGNLEVCDNWRRIASLDVVGKVLARLVQNRLREVVEEILPESQCGFRQSRGCTDMIFVVRQCIEKLYELREKGFLIFIDLKKAYDSVPRAALWLILAKAGLPDGLITIIRSFHDGMEAVVAMAGGTTQPIYVDNGLRQGCSLAPLLFNIFMWAVFSCWLKAIQSIDDVGLAYRYKLDGKLMFRRRRSDSPFRLTDCQFADDSVLMASSRQAAQSALDAFASIASSFGLSINVVKTKFFVACCGVIESDRQPLILHGSPVEYVADFLYLGSLIHCDGCSGYDMHSRSATAARAFGMLKKSILMIRG